MNSTLKYGLVLGLLVAVIFGFTLISQNVPDAVKPGDGGGDEPQVTSPPLNFTADEITYSPDASHVTKQLFPGTFETSDVPIAVTVAFQNPNKVPVRVSAAYRSCSACSAARMTTFTDQAVNEFVTRAAAGGSFPAGAVGPPSLLVPLALGALVRSSEWKDLDFERQGHSVEVPACSADGAPTWGLLQLGIQVRASGPTDRFIVLGESAGKRTQEKQTIRVLFAGVSPFMFQPKSIALGDIPEGSAPRESTVVVWSSTRSEDAFPAPVTQLNRSDPFFRVGTPVRLSPAERDGLAHVLGAGGMTPRVTAAWRVPFTVFRRRPDGGTPAGPVEPDIGPFVRDIGVTVPGTGFTMPFQVTATVTGLVSLIEGTKIDLKSFNAREGADKTATLVSDRVDLEKLEPVPDQTRPAYLAVSLGPPQPQAGRRTWSLSVTVPKNACVGDLPADSAVVLRARTKDGVQMVHVPVAGRGASR